MASTKPDELEFTIFEIVNGPEDEGDGEGCRGCGCSSCAESQPGCHGCGCSSCKAEE